MRLFKVTLVTLVVCLVSILLLSCASKLDTTSLSESQVVTVQRGNLTIDITAVGNLALSRTEDLAFEILGTVEEVLVKEGDTFEEGQVLARLDTSEWEDELTALEDKVTAAERTVTAKERAVTAAERQVTTKKLALLQTQVNLQAAEDNLDKVEEIAKLKDVVEKAEYDLRIARGMLAQPGTWEQYSMRLYEIDRLKELIADTEQELEEILVGSSVRLTTDEAIEVAMKKLEIEIAQGKLEDAQKAIEDAQLAVEDAKIAVEDAKKAVENVQKALDEAMNASPEVTAPFTGFITKVNVAGGDEVKKGTVAVVIADPTKFEADILVSEMNIFQVKLGGNASVQVDAMPMINLPAKVTHISPTATIQSGVVNYKVKVEVTALQPVMQERQQARSNLSSDNISSGAPSGGFRRPFAGDNLTQEQIDQMIQQRQQAQAGQPSGQPPQMPTMIPEDLQLREGLTVTVSVIVEQKSNVLLVPNAAIISRGGGTIVQVRKSDGTTEERAVQTGISNWQYTEVTEGLSEGEQVIVPQGTATTSTTSQQRQPSGGMFIPGMGRVR